MKAKRRVAIIIANYNGGVILRRCIAHLKSLENEIQEIILVDNASKDDALLHLKKEGFSKLQVIELKENRGISFAYNLGAKSSSAQYLLFLGADAFPSRGSITKLVDYLDQHFRVGLATGKVILRNGLIDKDAYRHFPTPGNALIHFLGLDRLYGKFFPDRTYFVQTGDFSAPFEIDVCISHFMFVRREAFDSIGGFDDNFFVYGEDIDFCYRLKQKGWRIICVPSAEILHYKGVSVGIRKESQDISSADKETKIKMARSSVEAMRKFFRKHYWEQYGFLTKWLVSRGIDLLLLWRVLKQKIS